MDLEKMAREGERKYAAHLKKRARAVHEASTEHVNVRMNELHHVVALTIAPALLEDGSHEQLEAELLAAANLARDQVDEASGSGDVSLRMNQLMTSSIMAMK